MVGEGREGGRLFETSFEPHVAQKVQKVQLYGFIGVWCARFLCDQKLTDM